MSQNHKQVVWKPRTSLVNCPLHWVSVRWLSLSKVQHCYKWRAVRVDEPECWSVREPHAVGVCSLKINASVWKDNLMGKNKVLKYCWLLKGYMYFCTMWVSICGCRYTQMNTYANKPQGVFTDVCCKPQLHLYRCQYCSNSPLLFLLYMRV